MEIAIFIFMGLMLALVVRLVAGSLDAERVERYIQQRGWTLLGKSWDPFGPGWFGEKSDRIYKVVYRDQHGHTHRAHVKTSLFTGVYLTNDVILEETMEPTDVEAEIARLRKRIDELESKARSTGKAMDRR